MQTLYIKLVLIEGQHAELRYAVKAPSGYEVKKLNIQSINRLIQRAKSSYYMMIPDLEGIGQELFCWLDGSGRWLSQAIEECNDDGLVLAIDVDKGLGHLPWETLHDGTQFLVKRVSPVVVPLRWVDRPTAASGRVPERPLRILFMAASPDDAISPLDFEEEEAQILTATKDISLDLRVEESGCISELENLLGRYREPFDIFHLSGHAYIENERPYFSTETETGTHYAAYAPEISRALRFRMPQLVFLSGCRTGESPSSGAVSSLAESLIEEGCSAVLGWGRSVTDTLATKAAAYLYGKLAAGYQLSEALASTYQHLIDSQAEDWHLLRLYVKGDCPKALVEPLGDRAWIPSELGHEQFLDPQGFVRVATPQEFVGRRRMLQRSLKALRKENKIGVVVYGLGGIGKSTAAARLIERLNGYDKIFIYKQLDESKLLKELANQCLSEAGQEILQGKLPLTQKLTKFLANGLNEPTQRLIFVLDDFEANLEFNTNNDVVLKVNAAPALTSLVKAANQSRLPHKIIITSRYNFSLPDLDQRFHREQLYELSGADLQKKCRRLQSFSLDSKVSIETQARALETANGNPRLLDWLNKVLQVTELSHKEILTEIDKTSQEFREDILAKELIERQTSKLRRMLGFCLVYQLPVPLSAIKAICPDSFDVENYISRSVSLGLLDLIFEESENLYRVPRVLESALNFPEGPIELYKAAVNNLKDVWLVQSFGNSVMKSDSRAFPIDDPIKHFTEKTIARLHELLRLSVAALDPGVLTAANLFLVMYLNRQSRYREVVELCDFVQNDAFRSVGVGITSYNILYNLAKAQGEIGEAEEAVKNHSRALELLELSRQQDESELGLSFYQNIKAAIMHDLASLYEHRGNYQKALDLSSQVIEIDRASGDRLGEAKALNLSANIKRNLGKSREAIDEYEQACEISKEVGDESLLFDIKNNLSTLRVELGQYDAWEYSIDDLSLEEFQHRDFNTKITLLSNDASFKMKRGEREEAKKILEYLNSHVSEIDNLWLKGVILHNLATLRSECGERNLAMTLYTQALEIHRQNGDQPHEALTLQEIGILYDRQGNTDDALQYLEQSYQVSLAIENTDIQSGALLRTAGILIDRDELEAAAEKIEVALQIEGVVETPEKYGLTLKEKARLKIKQGDYFIGRRLLEEALSQSQSAFDISLKASVLKLLGEVLIFLGEVEIATKYLKEALSIYQKSQSRESISSVERLLENARLKTPIELHQAADEAYKAGRLEAAISLIREALPMVDEAIDGDVKAKFLTSLSSLLIEGEDFEAGFDEGERAILLADRYELAEKEEIKEAILIARYNKLASLFKDSQNSLQAESLDEAMKAAAHCLRFSELMKDAVWTSDALAAVGYIVVQQGNYADGIEKIQNAIALAQANSVDGIEELQKTIDAANDQEAVRRYERACSAANRGERKEAIKLAQDACKFQIGVGSTYAQPVTLCLIGRLLIAGGEAAEGIEKLEKALELAKNVQSEELITSIQTIISDYQEAL